MGREREGEFNPKSSWNAEIPSICSVIWSDWQAGEDGDGWESIEGYPEKLHNLRRNPTQLITTAIDLYPLRIVPPEGYTTRSLAV